MNIKIIYLSLAISLCQLINAQSTGVEKNIFGIQIGTFGIWGNLESRLTNSIALRSEIGIDSGIWGGNFYPETGYVLTPVLTLEPRWYYNLNTRIKKSKNISNNSGNFVSLKSSYHPNWFAVSNYDNVQIVPDLSIIPTWGIRRSIGKNFNYEAGIGIGYRYYFAKNSGYSSNSSDAAVNLDLRIGYTF
ncbi:hypothetical protein [Flavobacterium sp.]|uniref:hypothetical protein n=1 Tax=Flavobacterium sp. TaxID=239 RepID=UPI002CFBB222|nr:hypothetical protein [Flavobacterium sp.]HSD06988.1 hypothetical protein [Flavobacterium sp.]